ncbi:ABC transporter ATP-binding protein [Sanguibacter suaedae]|uniref:ABC transporter ATP-binding protein n=1 Tax=Sanguibacter suaedae TaxID=2795737 RepID=A0A934MDA0_9MICO|nr:ABC transporter ATP-binding protein [Sanguibacter suaedae]MBI9114614.1 ABC transporter ATP-binding protein [Sanguibacter suaedae]
MDGSRPFWEKDVTVAVANVHMHYRVPSTRAAPGGRAAGVGRAVRKVVGSQPKVLVRALAGVSLAAYRGESIGIIGTNGSGKSTLLRVIAGLERPSRGEVVAETSPVLLGVNAALVPDLSGEQNVRLGCLAMGLSPERTEEVLPDVVDLAGIGDAVYLPMRTYSSGMGARLRFAIAAAANPRILLIDEALSTGDAAFKERSERRMDELRANAGTVFIVNHAAQVIEEMCTRAIWLDRGRVVLDGPAEETARRYRLWAWKVSKGEQDAADTLLKETIAESSPSSVKFAATAQRGSPVRHARRH